MTRKIKTDTERITNRNNKTLACYLNEIKLYDPLTAEEEYELCLLVVDGDVKAKEKLIKHNLRFVVSVAKQYYGDNITLGDLINEGNMGLILAAERFESSKGFKFISYAVWWIRKTIIEFLSNKGERVRIPVNKSYKIGKIREQYNTLEQRLSRGPSENELYESLGPDYTYEEVNLFYSHYYGHNEYLDDTMGDDSMTTKGDMLVNVSKGLNSDSLVKENDEEYRISKYLGILKPNQREVLERIYGLGGTDTSTMESISREMGITKERVRQLKEESLLILRSKIKFN